MPGPMGSGGLVVDVERDSKAVARPGYPGWRMPARGTLQRTQARNYTQHGAGLVNT